MSEWGEFFLIVKRVAFSKSDQGPSFITNHRWESYFFYDALAEGATNLCPPVLSHIQKLIGRERVRLVSRSIIVSAFMKPTIAAFTFLLLLLFLP